MTLSLFCLLFFFFLMIRRPTRSTRTDTLFPYTSLCRSNHTTEPLAAVIRSTLLKDGIVATVYEAPYGAWRQELLNPESGLYRYKPDAVVIAVDIAELRRMPDGALGEPAVRENIGAEGCDWQELWAVLDARLGRPVLQHLFVQPEEGLLGPAQRRL